MVESVGMQQVLQLSSVTVKAQMATQVQGPEVARAFDKELEKQTDREADKAHEIKDTPEEKTIREDGKGRKQQPAMAAKLRTKEVEEEEKEAREAMQSEMGQGSIINVVA
ncbi:hypothetical protein MNBD_NITROSPINAE01-698 [hydrothermal vent metagenome]|uniref:Uncharacterized protein n=1 Tax=hydrothermal vent metagenome TaxID=652676 RepID=A0A3B1CMM2_9ZZZZ